MGEHVVPRREGARFAGLAGIANEGHRAGRTTASQHPPLHRGEVLRLVDEHVTEGARFDGRRFVPVAGGVAEAERCVT